MTDGEGRLAREGEMAPGQVLARGDPPVRAEVVHQSECTRVTRLFLPEGTMTALAAPTSPATPAWSA